METAGSCKTLATTCIIVDITWKTTTSIFASRKTSNYSTKIDIFREMA